MDRKPKKYLLWKPEGRRPVGRPQRRWMEGVEVALERRETSRSEVEENARYRDRDNWREIIKCLPADRH